MTDGGAWSDDRLGRKREAKALLQFLEGRLSERRQRGSPASYVLNVDSGWGHGKTYFLTNIQRDLLREEAVVAYVDAWATDFSDDPLTAIMSAVERALEPHLKKRSVKKAWQGVIKSGGTLAISLTKGVSSKLLSRYAEHFGDDLMDAMDLGLDDGPAEDGSGSDEDKIGLGAAAEEVVHKIADSALSRLIAAFRKQEQSIATFKRQLSIIYKHINQNREWVRPIYILVDELDRCRPTYAIRMLESVKHLFATDGLVFIIATDTDQLAESVRAVYGANFESRGYLRRFFDRTYRFREPSYTEFIAYLIDRSGIDKGKLRCPSGLSIQAFSAIILQDFGASLRDAEQCFDMLHTFVTMWNYKVKIELGFALTLICLYHSGRLHVFNIVSGRSNAALVENVFRESTVVLKKVIGGNYHQERREITASTDALLNAYRKVMSRSLVKWSDEELSNDIAEAYVIGLMREEFALLHHNQHSHEAPPYSVFGTYHEYVELAYRLGEAAADQEDASRS